MKNYSLQAFVSTAGHFLVQHDGVTPFTLKEYAWRLSKAHEGIAGRGVTYVVSRIISAQTARQAHELFFEDLHLVTDGLAYYFSQPFTVEYWNFLISKEGDNIGYLSIHRLHPATILRDPVVQPQLEEMIDSLRNDSSFHEAVWQYNNLAKLDSVDSDVSTTQLQLCTLAESLATKSHVEACQVCGRGSYERTNRSDLRSFLGEELHGKLFGGGDILRNRLSHGRLHGTQFLPGNDTELAIVQISKKIADKYGYNNKLSDGVVDPIRSTNRWRGCTIAVAHDNEELDDFLVKLVDGTIRTQGTIGIDW